MNQGGLNYVFIRVMSASHFDCWTECLQLPFAGIGTWNHNTKYKLQVGCTRLANLKQPWQQQRLHQHTVELVCASCGSRPNHEQECDVRWYPRGAGLINERCWTLELILPYATVKLCYVIEKQNVFEKDVLGLANTAGLFFVWLARWALLFNLQSPVL